MSELQPACPNNGSCTDEDPPCAYCLMDARDFPTYLPNGQPLPPYGPDFPVHVPVCFTDGIPHALQHGRPEPVDGCVCDGAGECAICAALIATQRTK